MKVIIATKNNHKLKEFSRILTPLGFEVVSQSEAGIDVDVEETGTSFTENARLKAEAIFNLTGCATISDDSGIEVDYLDKAPGIYSARYGGEGLDDIDRYKLLLKNLKGVAEEKRTARYVCAIIMYLENKKEISILETCEGTIAFSPDGDGGFGYDPIFLFEGKSFSSISAEQKDEVSHRGKALRKLANILNELKLNEENKNDNK
jgi:XTP/dITP diphosphohydrolase